MQGQGLAIPSITPPTGGGAGKEDTSFQPMRVETQEGVFLLLFSSKLVSCFLLVFDVFFSRPILCHQPDISLVDGIVSRQRIDARTSWITCLAVVSSPGFGSRSENWKLQLLYFDGSKCFNSLWKHKYYQIFFIELIISQRISVACYQVQVCMSFYISPHVDVWIERNNLKVCFEDSEHVQSKAAQNLPPC